MPQQDDYTLLAVICGGQGQPVMDDGVRRGMKVTLERFHGELMDVLPHPLKC